MILREEDRRIYNFFFWEKSYLETTARQKKGAADLRWTNSHITGNKHPLRKKAKVSGMKQNI